ncbi:MAG: preprotein translocase subunit YajC [Planctomycetota bacterium]
MGNLSRVGWSALLLLSLVATGGWAQDQALRTSDASEIAGGMDGGNGPLATGDSPSRGSDGNESGLDGSLTASETVPSGTASAGRGASITSQEFWMQFFSNPISYLLLVMLALYLLIILPAQRTTRKTQREQKEMLTSLKKNDRVVTSFGVHGVISNIQTEAGTVTLRIDESTNAKLTVNRESIRVVKKD